ncbi:MAG: hypothetical protein GY784_11265 [Gammaproteobacteria bacterium]|nr:hypothetical protein [Gammaproteobacteria bacterium]
MPTHIDHIVTEVVAEPEPVTDGDSADKRWSELLKTEAYMKQIERYHRRLCAESFDD